MLSALAEYRNTAICGTLRGCQIFAGLPTGDLNRIAEVTSIKSLEKDEYLFREGEVSHGFYIVQSGAINLHRIDLAGKEHVIHIFRAGESFAEWTLAADGGYPTSARALEPSQLLLVHKSGFLDLVKRHPELSLRMLSSMATHLRLVLSQFEDITHKSVETRLATWLLNHCPAPTSEKPVTIQLTSTKRVIAAELGTVSETFSRTLAKFRQAELVWVEGKKVTLRNPAKLKERIEDVYAEPIFMPRTRTA